MDVRIDAFGSSSREESHYREIDREGKKRQSIRYFSHHATVQQLAAAGYGCRNAGFDRLTF